MEACSVRHTRLRIACSRCKRSRRKAVLCSWISLRPAPAWRLRSREIRGRWGSNSTPGEEAKRTEARPFTQDCPGSTETDTGTRGGCSYPGREGFEAPLSRLRTENFGPNQALD